ncbi:Unknown protein, partial [Striga hermonthica]
YLKESLFDVCNDSRRGPNLGHVVTKLAEHFRVQTDEPKLLPIWISQKDLFRADFLIDDNTPRLVTQRECYKVYLREMGLPVPDDQSQPTAGTSSGPAPADSHDDDGTATEAGEHPAQHTILPLPSMDAHTVHFPSRQLRLGSLRMRPGMMHVGFRSWSLTTGVGRSKPDSGTSSYRLMQNIGRPMTTDGIRGRSGSINSGAPGTLVLASGIPAG